MYFKYFKLILVSLDMSVKIYSTSDFMPRFCGILGMYCSKVTTRKGQIKLIHICFIQDCPSALKRLLLTSAVEQWPSISSLDVRQYPLRHQEHIIMRKICDSERRLGRIIQISYTIRQMSEFNNLRTFVFWPKNICWPNKNGWPNHTKFNVAFGQWPNHINTFYCIRPIFFWPNRTVFLISIIKFYIYWFDTVLKFFNRSTRNWIRIEIGLHYGRQEKSLRDKG